MSERNATVLRFLVTITTIVFVTEFSVMFLIPVILPEDAGNIAEALLDASLLSTLSFPLLWWSVARPLRQQVLLERDRFESIAQNSADGILVIDGKGVLSIFNPVAESIFGYRADEIIGSNVSLLVPSPHSQRHDGYIRHYLRTGLSDIVGRTREVSGRHRDGTVFPMELTVTESHVGHRRFFTASVKDLSWPKGATAHDEDRNRESSSGNVALTRFAQDLLIPATAIAEHSSWIIGQSCSDAETADSLCSIHDDAWSLLQSIDKALDKEPLGEESRCANSPSKDGILSNERQGSVSVLETSM